MYLLYCLIYIITHMLCHGGHKTYDRSHDIGGYNVYCPADPETITPCPCGHVVVPCNLTLGTCKRADGELYARWLQFGAVSPIMRTHCSHCDRRIWIYPQAQFDAMKVRKRTFCTNLCL
jgi:alpha-glucosidase (family GH31 glycosyl hydrolase)